MAHRFRLFRLFSIDITMEASWLLCAGLIGWTLARDVFPSVSPDLTPTFYGGMAVAATIGLFASIILHELGHSLVARRFGIPIHTITLFVFGGIAELEEEPPTAKSELLTAIAGPAVSLILAGLAFLGETAAIALNAPEPFIWILWYLAFVNTAVFLFNLVPAFPLDGGRVFRAGLWAWRGDLMWATSVACGVGATFGLFLMVLGGFDMVTGDVVGGAWRLLIGLFLRGAALSSREELLIRSLTAGVPVSAAMNPAPVTVAPSLSIDALIEDVVYHHPHRCFPVTDGRRLVGSIPLDRISLVEPMSRPVTWVSDIMLPITGDQTVSPDADLSSVSRRMRREGRHALWVVSGDALVGLFTLHDQQQYLLTHAALQARLRSWMNFSALP